MSPYLYEGVWLLLVLRAGCSASWAFEPASLTLSTMSRGQHTLGDKRALTGLYYRSPKVPGTTGLTRSNSILTVRKLRKRKRKRNGAVVQSSSRVLRLLEVDLGAVWLRRSRHRPARSLMQLRLRT